MKDFTPAELDEIRTSYRQAKSPRTQVDVLADLYACTRQDIERALGVPEGKVKTKVQKLRQLGRLPPAERPPARCADAAEDAPVLQECSAPGAECAQTQEATGAPDHARYGDLFIERTKRQEAASAEKPDKSPPALAVLAELDELIARAAEIAHALHVLSERGGGA